MSISRNDVTSLGRQELLNNPNDFREIFYHKTTGELYYPSGATKKLTKISNLASREDYEKYKKKILSKEGVKDIRVGFSASTEITGSCADIIKRHSLMKSAFSKPILAGTLLMLQEQRHKDNIFVNTARAIVNVPEGEDINKAALLDNLSRFVFGKKDGSYPSGSIFRKPVHRFNMVIYLALVTEHTLLPGIRNEDETFKYILDAAGSGILPKVWAIRAKSRTQACDREEVGSTVIGTPKSGVNCTFEEWANVYSVFPQSNLEKAIEKIIFE